MRGRSCSGCALLSVLLRICTVRCSSRWLLPAVLSAAASAQNDFDLDKTTAGTLGGTLQFSVRNAPANMLLIAMPSFTAGPTPILPFDPGDPRSLQVGT